jgi:hypothetical protein
MRIWAINLAECAGVQVLPPAPERRRVRLHLSRESGSGLKRWSCGLALLLVLSTSMPGFPAQSPQGPKTLTLTVTAGPESPRSGWDGKLEISAVIESGYHINSNKPTSEFLIPASVKFKLNSLVVFGPLEYPRGESKKLGFSEDKMSIYEGQVTIAAPFKAAAGAGPGMVKIQGVFAYQACTDQVCLPPRTEDFEVQVSLPKR